MTRRRSGRRRNRRTCGRSLLIAINKPYGEVTRSVDNFVGKALGDDGVGHIGTLDPAVTGVLVLAIGQARKLIPGIEEGRRKAYSATIRFGTQTTTDDAEGQVVRTSDVPPCVFDEEYARKTLASLEGPGRQRPPRYSAVKVDGVRAYDRARAGEEFELPERDIVVYEASLTKAGSPHDPSWHCDFVVSPGTYIRAIARDLGPMVGSVAHLAALCRTASGLVTLDDCVTPQQVADLGLDEIHKVELDPAKVLGLPVYKLTKQELEHVGNGRAFVPTNAQGDSLGPFVSLVHGNMLYGVWRICDDMLHPHINCPLGVEGVRE